MRRYDFIAYRAMWLIYERMVIILGYKLLYAYGEGVPSINFEIGKNLGEVYFSPFINSSSPTPSMQYPCQLSGTSLATATSHAIA